MPEPQTSTKPTLEHWNVAGGRLALFSKNPPTGFLRDGYCRVTPEDKGNHSIAATVTQDFLDFSASKGNNLKDVGVKDGMKWCLCASRFQEAIQAAENGELSQAAVPRVALHASDKKALDVLTYKDLKKYAAEPDGVAGPRQGDHHDPSSEKGVASHSQEIGSAQPTEAPGAGRNQSKKGSVTDTSANRG